MKQGYKILDTDWQCSYGKADIVAKINDVLVFVKTRATDVNTENAFPDEDDKTKMRTQWENVAVSYLVCHPDCVDLAMQLNVIDVSKIDSNRYVIKHHVNALSR